MIVFGDKTAEALEYVRKAEKIMTELGHTKYSLSGMCSAAMRHDLEKEVGELLGKLVEARKEIENLNKIIDAATNSANASHLRAIEYQSQRDTLAEALREFIEEQCEHRPHDHSDALGNARKALAAVKGGNNE
jgi:predicted RNase H-like nuclease (RuvC/YqgF family)